MWLKLVVVSVGWLGAVCALADGAAGRAPRFVVEMPGAVACVGVSRDGGLVAARLKDEKVVVVCDRAGKEVGRFATEGFRAVRLKFSDDGAVLFCESLTGIFTPGRQYEVWRVRDGRVLFSNVGKAGDALFRVGGPPRLWCADLAPDGLTLAGCVAKEGGSGVTVFELATAKRSTLEVKVAWPGFEARYSPDGKYLVWIGRELRNGANGVVSVVRLSDRRVVQTFPDEYATFAGFGEGGRVIATKKGEREGEARVLEIHEGNAAEKLRFKYQQLYGADALSGGRLMAAAFDRAVGVWRMDTGAVEMTLELPEDATAHEFEFGAAGAFLATGDGGKRISVWEFGG